MSTLPVAFIYVLRCEPSGKVYVGSAKDAAKRIREHFNALNKGRHENPYLQKAWDKYGKEQFTSKIVQTCFEKLRWRCEQNWIDNLQACNSEFGFNLLHSVRKTAPSQVMSKILKAYWAERWADTEYSKKRTEQLRQISKTPEVKAKMRTSKLNSWKDPEYRTKQSKAHKAYAADPTIKERLRQQAKKLWQDPEYRAKQLKERKARFKDKVFRAKLSEAASKRCTASWITKRSHNEIV